MMTGSIVALVTPMTLNGEIDWPALRHLVRWHIEQGTTAIVAAGTTGEPSTMTVKEHLEVIKAIIEEANQQIDVIAGTGANATWEAVELASQAKSLGAKYCLSVTPYYNRPTQEGMYQHFKAVAEVGLPVILYNVPKRTGVNLTNETVYRLAKLDNVYGIKEASGDMQRAKELHQYFQNENFALYSGDDPTAVQWMLMGGHGVISVAANIIPKMMQELAQACLNQQNARAQQLEQNLQPLFQALAVEPNPIPIKWALAQMGYIQDVLRLPLMSLSKVSQPTVLQQLQRLNLIKAGVTN